MPSKPELRVALLGQGFMGRAHSNAWLQVGRFFDVPYHVRRKVICGRDVAQLTRMAQDWEWEETAVDWRAVVERADVDLVDIALPNHLHAPVAMAAAAAGKMVLCEKPWLMIRKKRRRWRRRAAGFRTVFGSTTGGFRRLPTRSG